MEDFMCQVLTIIVIWVPYKKCLCLTLFVFTFFTFSVWWWKNWLQDYWGYICFYRPWKDCLSAFINIQQRCLFGYTERLDYFFKFWFITSRRFFWFFGATPNFGIYAIKSKFKILYLYFFPYRFVGFLLNWVNWYVEDLLRFRSVRQEVKWSNNLMLKLLICNIELTQSIPTKLGWMQRFVVQTKVFVKVMMVWV